MTYKNSFLTSLKENGKRRNWVFIVTFISYIIYFPITTLLMGLANQNSYYGVNAVPSDYYIFQDVRDLTYLGYNGFSAILVICIALFCAFQGYGYLHNKQKLDFYQSVPVNKTKRFFTIYFNGYIIFVAAYLSQLLFTLLITMIFQPLTSTILASGFTGFLSNLAVFFMCYNIFILAMVLTGNIVIAGVAAIILSGYELAIRYLIYMLCDIFFLKFSYHADEVMMTTYTSPILTLFEMNYWSLLGCGLASIGLAYYAYSIRKVDGCNKAVAFPQLRILLKFAITIPVSLLSGLALYSMTSSNYIALYLGIIIGCILLHMLFESIYAGDVRGCFGKVTHMIAILSMSIITMLTYQFDVFGYDSYVPKEDQVESIAIEGLAFNYSWINFAQVEEYGYRYDSPMSIIGENMMISDVAPVLALSSLPANQEILDSCETIEVMYRMKNGMTKYRRVSYLPTDEQTVAYMNALFADPNYKTKMEQIYEPFFDDTSGTEFMVNVRGALDELQIDSISRDDRNELIECYREDFLALSYEEISTSIAIGELGITYMQYDEKRNSYSNNFGMEYPIYPGFTKTISYLQSHGYFRNELDGSQIISAEVSQYNVEKEETEYIVLTIEQVMEAHENGYFTSRDCFYWYNNIVNTEYDQYVSVRIDYSGEMYDDMETNTQAYDVSMVEETEAISDDSRILSFDVMISKRDLAEILK